MKVWALSLLLIFVTACSVARPYGSSLTAASEVPLTGCALEEKNLFDAYSAGQMQWYAARGALPIPEYRSRLLHGTNGRAIVVAHGYASSPYTLSELMQGLNDAGYTVIAPLLNGYGSTDTIANGATAADWYGSITAAMSIAQHCHGDISLLALSLGGTLTLDGILNRGLGGISHYVGLSAFVKASTSVNLLDTTFYPGTPSLSITTLESFTGGVDPYSYLPYDPPPSGAPPTYFPVLALHAMLSLTQTLQATGAAAVSSVPALEVVSDADGIMDAAASMAFLAAHFSHVSKVEYPSGDDIGHSLETRHANPHFDQMVQQIISFLGSST